jgi:hypothetical protein
MRERENKLKKNKERTSPVTNLGAMGEGDDDDVPQVS